MRIRSLCSRRSTAVCGTRSSSRHARAPRLPLPAPGSPLPPLQVLLAAFYHVNGTKAARSDYMLYMILSYLTLFRLDEMGFAAYAELLRSFDPLKIHTLLSFLFDLDKLDEWVKDEWVTILDESFIEVRARARAHTHAHCR